MTYTNGVVADFQTTIMAQQFEDHNVALETFHIQEGNTIRLRKFIIDSVLKKLIVELEKENTFFNKILPRDLLTGITVNATPVTTLESMELIQIHDTTLFFVTNKKLSLQLK